MKLFALWTYLGWFACIYAAKYGYDTASLIVPVITWIMLAKVYNHSRLDGIKLFILASIGVLFESATLFMGWISLIGNPTFIPIWFISLWLHFVPSLFLFKPWLTTRPLSAAALGAVFGPLSYISGEQLGVLTFSAPIVKVYYLVFWAAFIPLALLALKPAEISSSPTPEQT